MRQQWVQNPLVELFANVRLALESHHIGNTDPLRDFYFRIIVGELIADIFGEKQCQHIVFVLAGVHAAAPGVAALPKLGVDSGLGIGGSVMACTPPYAIPPRKSKTENFKSIQGTRMGLFMREQMPLSSSRQIS